MSHTSMAKLCPEFVCATAQSHAGEILQGAIRRDGRTRRILVSLPAPSLYTRATVCATPGRPLTVQPANAHKTRAAVQTLVRHLNIPAPEVTIELTTNIPVGKGCGSSTTDMLAAVRALSKYLGIHLDEIEAAKILVDVEEASDSTVLSRPAVFRHREGLVEEYLPGPLPSMRVIVIDAQPDSRVDTLSLERARYSDKQLDEFERLIGRLRHAFRQNCPHSVGEVATASARISQQFLPKPYFEAVAAALQCHGAYGVAAAHSGTTLAAMLPAEAPNEIRLRIKASTERFGMKVLTEYALNNKLTLQSAA